MSPFTEKLSIQQSDIKIFADVAGDPNPIHQSNEVARQMGLEGAIAHGMYVYSYLLRRLDEWILNQKQTYSKNWDLVSTRCRFHEPAVIGKTFESVLELSDETETSGKMTMTFYDENKTRLVLVVAQLRKV